MATHIEPPLLEQLLARIDAHLRRTGITESAFGKVVSGDHKFLRRLREGQGFTDSTYDRCISVMRGEPRGALHPTKGRPRAAQQIHD